MTNVEKMQLVAKLVAEKKYPKAHTDAILRGVAEETGFSLQAVRAVYTAALLVGGQAPAVVK